MPLHTLSHPLAAHVMTHLRDSHTKSPSFRTLTHQVSLLLAIEATRKLPTRPQPIDTPLESLIGQVLAQPLVIVPILRAGLGMLTPFLELFPEASVGYIGLERDEQTAVADKYYCKLPDLVGAHVILLDPMLATGGSAGQAISLVKTAGAASDRISFVCIVSAPEGVTTIETQHPEVPIYTAAHDRVLNVQKYILPGLGDFGDRLYST